MTGQIVSNDQWLAARRALLEKEKEFTRARDALSAARRALPWEKVETGYVFEGANGNVTLPDLFRGRSQLIVFHFMFGPDWEAGCKSCSFWADNFDRIIVHLRARDTNLVAVSRAPYQRLAAYRQRMGWSFEWVSSLGNAFNRDFAVSFPKDGASEVDDRANNYNFATQHFGGEEAPGISVFAREKDKDLGGAIYHTYSTYARGLDMLNGAYHLLDLTPKGRDEAGLSFTMEWVRRHDEYAKA
jgi:predicted dithiol-disulfide oxidoreductase (DUF899 family)